MLAAVPLAARQNSGVVSNVTATSGQNGETVFTITGTNPCRAVQIDYGDGSLPVTHAVRSLPSAVTHTFAGNGVYQVRVRGVGVCGGEAVRSVRVGGAVGRGSGAARGRGRAGARFEGFDTNEDGVIQRGEWRGSDQSFQVHDWNNDGVLSGDEVRTGVARPRPEFDDYSDPYAFSDWSGDRFTQLDRNRDGRVSRTEWPYGVEEFFRADRNRDGSLSTTEFAGSDFDDDRGDRFEYLDANGNGTIERGEWHASAAAFNWLDRDNNNQISRQEMGIASATATDTFAVLDVNRDQRLSKSEWVWSQRSFDQRDSNRDGALTRAELAAAIGGGSSAGGRATIVVQANQQWTDTGMDVQAGDRLSFTASGSVQLSSGNDDIADPGGARSGRMAPDGPFPRDKAGSLIAKIGDAAPILIGTRADAVRAPNSGRLYLSVNDDYHQDNKGSFNVQVVVAR
jgi:Ca2+-binding EF-hand superfamily protein